MQAIAGRSGWPVARRRDHTRVLGAGNLSGRRTAVVGSADGETISARNTRRLNSLRSAADRLREVEVVVWIDAVADLFQARERTAVVRLFPAVELMVDVVLVGCQTCGRIFVHAWSSHAFEVVSGA